MDTPIYKRSIAALRCFKRATELDSSNSKLWIEYGSLAYQLHSHAARQIRWVGATTYVDLVSTGALEFQFISKLFLFFDGYTFCDKLDIA